MPSIKLSYSARAAVISWRKVGSAWRRATRAEASWRVTSMSECQVDGVAHRLRLNADEAHQCSDGYDGPKSLLR